MNVSRCTVVAVNSFPIVTKFFLCVKLMIKLISAGKLIYIYYEFYSNFFQKIYKEY